MKVTTPQPGRVATAGRSKALIWHDDHDAATRRLGKPGSTAPATGSKPAQSPALASDASQPGPQVLAIARNPGASSARLYWESTANNFNAVDISIPAAITVFPGEIYQAPQSWAERAYHNLIYFHEVDKSSSRWRAWWQRVAMTAGSGGTRRSANYLV